jgi:hypothetical protein
MTRGTRNIIAAFVAGFVLLSCVPSLQANTVTVQEQVCEPRGFANLERCYKLEVVWRRWTDKLRADNVYIRRVVVSDVYMRALYESRNGPITSGKTLLGLSEITELEEPMRYGISSFRYLCTVYLLDIRDDDTYAHERMHCLGWEHD